MSGLLRRHWWMLLAAVMVVVGLTGWLITVDAHHTDAAGNHAVVDQAATGQVQKEVSRALTSVLSYDFNDPGASEAAAEKLLTGKARKEYDTLFAALKKKAPGQQLVLTAQVEAAAVKELTDDSAKLLVFLDQTSRRATDKENTVSAAQLSITAERTGGHWQITGLKPL